MVDREQLTVEEILAHCRRVDGVKENSTYMSEVVESTGQSQRSISAGATGASSADSGTGCQGSATHDGHNPHSETARRGFFRSSARGLFIPWLAIGFTSLTATCIAWTFGLIRFMFPNVLAEPPTKFKVGLPDNLAPGTVDVRYKTRHGVWIVRHEYQGEAQIFALKAVCTHLGCIPIWIESEQSFTCPCHGSSFHKDGINYEGPAPRPLERFAIQIANDGQLEVDTSRTYHEELGQWSDPSCFVSS